MQVKHKKATSAIKAKRIELQGSLSTAAAVSCKIFLLHKFRVLRYLYLFLLFATAKAFIKNKSPKTLQNGLAQYVSPCKLHMNLFCTFAELTAMNTHLIKY